MTIPELLLRPDDFRRMMISRLESDLDEMKCPGSKLWGGTMEYHMEVLAALCKSVGLATTRTAPKEEKPLFWQLKKTLERRLVIGCNDDNQSPQERTSRL